MRRLHSSWVAAGLLACALAPAGSPAQSALPDLCESPEVQRVVPLDRCLARPVLFGDAGGMRPTVMANVTSGWLQRIDGSTTQNVLAFLLVPGVGVVQLPEPVGAGGGEFKVYSQLGYALMSAGGLPSSRDSLFFDRLIERRLGGYCLVHRMKPPFTGELADCGGKVDGTVGYGPGMLTWRQAGRRICDLVAAETGTPCTSNGVSIPFNAIVRDADGSLQYRITATRNVRSRPDLAQTGSVPVEYERRSYEMDLEGSMPRLVATRWELCSSGGCRPFEPRSGSAGAAP